nr:MAG: hypothetical protein AM325_11705 [Candidatus Thorarchaeota archaeon SMTZ1-45]
MIALNSSSNRVEISATFGFIGFSSPNSRPIAIRAPVKAPQTLPVRFIPPLKADAIFIQVSASTPFSPM